MATLYENIRPYENSRRAALYFEGKCISSKDMHKNIRRAVSYLNAHGIGRGDVVTVALPNIPSAVYFFYALDIVGAVQNIMHPLCTLSQLCEGAKKTGSRDILLLENHYSELCRESDADTAFFGMRFFFANPMYDASAFLRYGFYLKCKHAQDDSKRVFLLDRYHTFPPKEDIDSCTRPDTEDSVLLHSGGTTSEPKIIALSDRAISALADKVDCIVPDIEGMGMLAVLPIFHGFGLGMGVHAPLSGGAASVLMVKFNPKKVIKLINANRVNLIIGVPALYRRLMDTDAFALAKLKNLEYCFIGGDNVLPSLIEEFDLLMEKSGSECRLYEGYGLTETVTVCTVNTRTASKPHSVGRALRGITVSIRDEQLKELECEQTGEVFICSDTQMNCYHNDMHTTKQTICHIDGRDWVRTGDLGYLDSEGYLYLRGRKKRTFKISGINVFPSEIEKTAVSVEGVREAALEFFPTPKPHTVLYLIRAKDSPLTKEQTKQQVLSLIQATQLKYSMPSGVVFLDEFPKTRVGKTDHSGFSDIEA